MKRYQVSKGFKYALMVAALGLSLLFVFLMELARFYFPIKLTEGRLASLRTNQIVKITTSRCYPKVEGRNHGDQFTLDLFSDTIYYEYQLRVGTNGVATVCISDKSITFGAQS